MSDKSCYKSDRVHMLETDWYIHYSGHHHRTWLSLKWGRNNDSPDTTASDSILRDLLVNSYEFNNISNTNIAHFSKLSGLVLIVI